MMSLKTIHFPSLRPHSLRDTLPFVFDNKKEIWPNAAQSVSQPDQPSLRLGMLNCWEVTGPALEVLNDLRLDIQALLDNNKDEIERGEAKPRRVSFNMFMVGLQPQSANPVIVFISKSSRQRNYAKTLLKHSRLLDKHPSIRIKTLNKQPPEPRAVPSESEHHYTEDDENGVFLIDGTRGHCGAKIAIGRERLARMGGVLLINGNYYGITAQHTRFEASTEPDDSVDSEPLCFDEDSDDEHMASVEITSKGEHVRQHRTRKS